MTNPHVQALLLAYLLAPTEEPHRQRLEAHLLDCRDCLAAYFELKRGLELASAAPERPSADTRARLRASVARALPRRQAVPWVLAGVGAAATAALVLWSGHHSRPSAPEERAWIDTGSDLRIPPVL